MEPEANLSQDIAPTDAIEPLEETPVATEETAAPQQVDETKEQSVNEDIEPSPTNDETADSLPKTSEPQASESVEEQPEEASAGQSDVVVATEDVAPARSRMDLARIAKEALVERAKELSDSTDWRKTSEAQRELMEQWRKAGYAGKEVNDKLWNDFHEARQEFFSRRETEVVKIKQAIIAEAHDASDNVTNWIGAANKLDALMERWKAAGNSGSESDKALWEEFNGIRRDFRNRRKADLDKRRATAQANAAAKREIVDEAARIAEAAEYTRENSDRMRQLDKDYKAIGFAGKPANDTLWAEFTAARNSYWSGNSAFMDEQRKRRSDRLQEVVERKADQIEHLKSQNETLTTRLGSTLDPEKKALIMSWIAQNDERVDDLTEDVEDIKKKI